MWPPSTQRLSPPKQPLLLNSAFQRMCAYSADLNFRLPARHTRPTSYAASRMSSFPRMFHFSLLSLIFFPCPWNTAQSCACTLLRACPTCLFFWSISCFERSLLRQKRGAPCSSDTWEGAGTVSLKRSSTQKAVLSYISAGKACKDPVWDICKESCAQIAYLRASYSATVAGLDLNMSQRASQRPLTSGWRNSTCDLRHWPPAVAAFLLSVHIQPVEELQPDCPEARSTHFSKRLTVWTNPACRNVVQYDETYQEKFEIPLRWDNPSIYVVVFPNSILNYLFISVQ